MNPVCAACGQQNEAGAGFCEHCGASLRAARQVCAYCASPNDSDARFCKGCGASLGSAAAPSGVVATAPAHSAKAPPPLATPQSFAGLYHFVRSHLLIVNSLVGFASTAVALLDFLSPRLWILPRVVYSATALLACVLLATAMVPGLDRWLLGWLFRSEDSRHPLWRRGGWQFAVLLLALVSGFGFESVAKAQQGGVIVSAIPGLRGWQQRLLSIDAKLQVVKVGVAAANTKLDRIEADINPANPADRCADLDCAISGGASAKAVRALFAKGETLPGSSIVVNSMLWTAATTPNPDQAQIVDLLLQHGADAQAPLLVYLEDSRLLTIVGQRNSQAIFDKADLAANPMAGLLAMPGPQVLKTWNAVEGCLDDPLHHRGPTLIEGAALLGNSTLVAHLQAEGIHFPARPLLCTWSAPGGIHAEVRVHFDPSSGSVARIDGSVVIPPQMRGFMPSASATTAPVPSPIFTPQAPAARRE